MKTTFVPTQIDSVETAILMAGMTFELTVRVMLLLVGLDAVAQDALTLNTQERTSPFEGT